MQRISICDTCPCRNRFSPNSNVLVIILWTYKVVLSWHHEKWACSGFSHINVFDFLIFNHSKLNIFGIWTTGSGNWWWAFFSVFKSHYLSVFLSGGVSQVFPGQFGKDRTVGKSRPHCRGTTNHTSPAGRMADGADGCDSTQPVCWIEKWNRCLPVLSHVSTLVCSCVNSLSPTLSKASLFSLHHPPTHPIQDPISK